MRSPRSRKVAKGGARADARGAGPLRAGEPTCAAFGAAPGMVMSAIDLDDDRGQRPCSSGSSPLWAPSPILPGAPVRTRQLYSVLRGG